MLSFSNLRDFLCFCIVPIARGNWLPDHFVLWTGCTVTRSRQSGFRDHQCLIGGWQKMRARLFLLALVASFGYFTFGLAVAWPAAALPSIRFAPYLLFTFVIFVCNIPTNNYCLFLHSYPQHSHLQDSLPQSFLEPNSGATIMDRVISQLWGFCRHNISYPIYMHDNDFNLVPALVNQCCWQIRAIFVGSILSGLTSKSLGARRGLLLCSTISALGWILIFLAAFLSLLEPLFPGVFLIGFSCGFSNPLTTVYVSETVGSGNKGVITSMFNCQVNKSTDLIEPLGLSFF